MATSNLQRLRTCLLWSWTLSFSLFYSNRVLCGSLGYSFSTDIVPSNLLTDQQHTEGSHCNTTTETGFRYIVHLWVRNRSCSFALVWAHILCISLTEVIQIINDSIAGNRTGFGATGMYIYFLLKRQFSEATVAFVWQHELGSFKQLLLKEV